MYWFWDWMKSNSVRDKESLKAAILATTGVDRLTDRAPEPVIFQRDVPPLDSEITAGKGFDLTGDLGCHHIDCLSKEIDGLFRHVWHYFDKISVPDQACRALLAFEHHKDRARLVDDLEPFVLVLNKIDKINGLDLIRFEVRNPPCRQHLQEHAREAGIAQAFVNIEDLTGELVRDARIQWKDGDATDHFHLDYRLDHPFFLHSEWGSLCSKSDPIPDDRSQRAKAIAQNVVNKYLAALSSDALASRRAYAPLGSSIPFYRKLLATHPSPSVDEVAFELKLPISTNVSLGSLIQLRREEGDAFARFQSALRLAISERLKIAGQTNATILADEIRRDVIDPALAEINMTLTTSRSFAARSAGVGVIIGAAVASVGLLTPLATNIAGGLVVGGAVTIAAQALKKANDDELIALREVRMSDLYFLFRAHQH